MGCYIGLAMTKRNRPTKIQSDIEKLMMAFLDSRHMDQLKSYRERGRRFEALADQQLEAQYVDAHNAFLGDNDLSRIEECNDLTAEYNMRGKEPPAGLLKDALDKASERMKGFDSSKVKPTPDDDLTAFLENYLLSPKN